MAEQHPSASEHDSSRAEASSDAEAASHSEAGESPSSVESKPARKEKHWGRRFGLGLVVVVLILVGLFFAAPTILSTGAGNSAVVNVVNGMIPGSIRAKHIGVSWFGGQSVRDLTLMDPQGQTVAVVNRVDAPQASLLPIIFGSRDFGSVKIAVAQADIKQKAGERTNLQQALSKPPKKPARPKPPENKPRKPKPPTNIGPTSVNLQFTAKNIRYETPGMKPVEATHVQGHLKMPDPGHIDFSLKSGLNQAGQAGIIDAQGRLTDAFSSDGAAQWDQASVRTDTKVKNLPVGMVDRIADQHGKLTALLGPRLNANIQANGTLSQLSAKLQAQSQRLGARMQLVNRGGALRAKQGSTMSLQVTPEAFAILMGEGGDQSNGVVASATHVRPMGGKQGGGQQPVESGPGSQSKGGSGAAAGAGKAMRLLQPFTMKFNLAGLTVPKAKNGLAVADTSIDATATATPIKLDVPEQGRVGLSHFKLALNSPKLSQSVTATLNAVAQAAGVQKPVEAKATVKHLMGSSQPLAAVLDVTQLPVALVDAVAKQHGGLTRTLGATADLHVQATQPRGGGYAASGLWNSPHLHAPFQGSYGHGGLITLTTPEPLQLTLTPAAFDYWMSSGSSAASSAGGTGEAPTSGGSDHAPADAGSSGTSGGQIELLQPMVVRVNLKRFAFATMSPRAEHAAQTPHVAPADASVGAKARGGSGAKAPSPPGSALRLDPARTHINAEIAIPHARLRDTANGKRVVIKEGSLAIQGQNLRKLLNILVNMKVSTLQAMNPSHHQNEGRLNGTARPSKGDPPPADGASSSSSSSDQSRSRSQSGSIQSHTSLRGLLSSDGTVQLKQAAIKSDTKIDAIPSALIDALAGQKGTLAAILGPLTSANAQINYQPGRGGPITLNIQSANVHGDLEGNVTPDRKLHLRKNARFALHITPAVSKALLANINPMLADVGSANVPLKLRVNQKDFSMPLGKFEWKSVSAAAHLDAGKLTLLSSGFSGKVLGLLDKANVLQRQSNYSANLLPVNFDIDHGKLTYDHLALGFGGVRLGFSGNVNLVNHQIDLSMGLAGRKLPKQVQGLTLPISGSISQPDLSADAFVKALAKQGLQQGLQKYVPKNARGALGQILGGNPTESGHQPNRETGDNRGHRRNHQPNQRQPNDSSQSDKGLGGLLDLGQQILRQQQDKQTGERGNGTQ